MDTFSGYYLNLKSNNFLKTLPDFERVYFTNHILMVTPTPLNSKYIDMHVSLY